MRVKFLPRSRRASSGCRSFPFIGPSSQHAFRRLKISFHSTATATADANDWRLTGLTVDHCHFNWHDLMRVWWIENYLNITRKASALSDRGKTGMDWWRRNRWSIKKKEREVVVNCLCGGIGSGSWQQIDNLLPPMTGHYSVQFDEFYSNYIPNVRPAWWRLVDWGCVSSTSTLWGSDFVIFGRVGKLVGIH